MANRLPESDYEVADRAEARTSRVARHYRRTTRTTAHRIKRAAYRLGGVAHVCRQAKDGTYDVVVWPMIGTTMDDVLEEAGVE